MSGIMLTVSGKDDVDTWVYVKNCTDKTEMYEPLYGSHGVIQLSVDELKNLLEFCGCNVFEVNKN